MGNLAHYDDSKGGFTCVLLVSAIILSNIVLKEPIPWSYWVGIACVLLAIILITRSSPKTV